MDTQFLNTFVTVVDHGSMAAAARLLNITPAAVAQQVRTLEREIGAPLIARAGRTVSVTEEGIEAKATRLTGTRVRLPFPSVGATESILLSAVRA